MTSFGIDYAWYSHGAPPNAITVKRAGYDFICRYISRDPSKDLTGPELRAAMTAGLGVVFVFEDTAERMKSGRAAGIADATIAQARVSGFSYPNIPVYFACDFDAAPGDQVAINAYLDGCAEILGRSRVGIYSGYYPLKRAFDAKKVTYGWQTFAWSGGQWDSRAQIRQIQNGITVAGQDSDKDENMTEDNQHAGAATAMTTVPQLTGQSAGAAHNALVSAGLVPTADAGQKAGDIVSATNPAGGTSVPHGSSVRIETAAAATHHGLLVLPDLTTRSVSSSDGSTWH